MILAGKVALAQDTEDKIKYDFTAYEQTKNLEGGKLSTRTQERI